MTDTYSHERFAQHINTVFHLVSPGAPPIPLELVEVSQKRQFDRFEAFSIVLRGPASLYIPQANYHFEHEQLDSLDMFIVPIRQNQQGMYYEATFNVLSTEVPA